MAQPLPEPTSATPAQPKIDPKARALELFKQSKDKYRSGDFQAAANLLEPARKIGHLAAIVCVQCQRKMRRQHGFDLGLEHPHGPLLIQFSFAAEEKIKMRCNLRKSMCCEK